MRFFSFSRYGAEVLLIILTFIAYLPLAFGHALASLIVLARRLCQKKEKQIFLANVNRVYGFKQHSPFTNLFLDQVYYNQARTALETIRAILRPNQLQLDGYEELAALVQPLSHDRTKGFIAITAHLGSWELAGSFVAKALGRDFFVLAKPSRYSWATIFLDKLRRKMGTFVLWTNKKSLPRDMIACLDAGKGLGFVMDQKPQGRVGPKVLFFDQATEFVGGPAMMALRKNVPIIATFCIRLGPSYFRLVSRVIYNPSADTGKDLTAITQDAAQAIEEAIRQYPDQWCWDYKRWAL